MNFPIADELGDYFADMRKLIEETYALNHGERSILLCHSLGCPVMLYFLNQQEQTWKDTYVRSLFSLGGVWGGAVKSLKTFATGDNFGAVVVASLTIRDDERTFPSLAYLLPNTNIFNASQVLVETPQRNYTIQDYKQYFDDINYPVGYEMWEDVKDLTWNLTAPGVEVFCFHGNGSDTPEVLIYDESSGFPDGQPKSISYGDGDGTVNLASLSACQKWSSEQAQPVHYQQIVGLDHMQILYDLRVLGALADHGLGREPRDWSVLATKGVKDFDDQAYRA